jgi:phenylpropionate dioxygenase-like ring-hydroxylating dioxygenase large terminal subunit
MANLVRALGDYSLASYIDGENGTVSRELYVNSEIFEQEMEQIFQRCWLFLGHESQLPNPGDFIISRMGTEEVIVVRDRKDHKIRAFLNSCRHRGMKVCRYDEGNNLVFTCPYHAWTYDTKGKLVGAGFYNHPGAYTDTLPKEDWGLLEVGQFTNFYGSLWATWDPKAPSFEDYLGPFTHSLRHCLQSSDGEDNGLEFFRPFQRHRLPTNWKVPGFTSVTDLTHTAMTHRSAQAAGLHQDQGQGKDKPTKPFPQEKYAIGDHLLGHGGMCTFYNEPGVPEYTNEWFEPGVDDYFREATERKGSKLIDQIMAPHGWGGGHFAIFPAVMIDSWRLRWYHPHETGMTERWTLSGVDKNAPKAVKDAVRHYSERFNGPVGFFESDDMENWNYVWPASRGARARKANYFYANGLGHGVYDDRLPGVVVNGSYTEEAQRARFSRWLAFMQARSWDDLYPVNKSKTDRIW